MRLKAYTRCSQDNIFHKNSIEAIKPINAYLVQKEYFQRFNCMDLIETNLTESRLITPRNKLIYFY